VANAIVLNLIILIIYTFPALKVIVVHYPNDENKEAENERAGTEPALSTTLITSV
jgi:hypothetical protein